MKKMTFIFTLLACLCVLNSCSRGYGCPYSATELKPLDQQPVMTTSTAVAKLDETAELTETNELMAD